MKEKIDYLSTLFVGIDIASRIHVISALDFNQEFFIKMKPIENTQEGAVLLERMIVDLLTENHQFKYVVIGMESTGFYGVHLANYLSASDLLAPFSVRVYCLNPKEVKNYKKSINDIGKNLLKTLLHSSTLKVKAVLLIRKKRLKSYRLQLVIHTDLINVSMNHLRYQLPLPLTASAPLKRN